MKAFKVTFSRQGWIYEVEVSALSREDAEKKILDGDPHAQITRIDEVD